MEATITGTKTLANWDPKAVLVETYNLTAPNGKHIRRATQLTFSNKKVVRFMEKMTRKQVRAYVDAQKVSA